MGSCKFLSLLMLHLIGLLLIGCSTKSEQPEAFDDYVNVDFVLSGTTITPIHRSEIETTTSSIEISTDLLEWQFESEDGTVLEQGFVADPRQFTSEFDEYGNADPVSVSRGVGIFSLDLPKQKGVIRLLEPDTSVEVATAELNLSDSVVLQHEESLVNLSSDLIGEPQLVSGSGSTDNLSILFVPDGFTESEQENFHTAVNKVATGLSSLSGYKEHWDQINLWRQDVRSPESGIADPNFNTNPTTAFEATFGDGDSHRCVMFDKSVSIKVLAALTLIRKSVKAQAIVVIANSTINGGCANTYAKLAFITMYEYNKYALAHELGHSIFGLADEYEENNDETCSPKTGPNVSSKLSNLPWKAMINTSSLPTPLDAPQSTIGAFEGAGLCSKGAYRPQEDCMMRYLTNFCAVCMHEIDEYFAALPKSTTGTTTSSTTTTSTSASCTHPETTVGTMLSSTCSTCTDDVCSTDVYCCNTSWDEQCVSEAEEICATSCAHSECTTGSSLLKTCSICVSTVCAADSYCCANEWDEQCVSEAEEMCGLSCQ